MDFTAGGVFGVCTYWAGKRGVSTDKVRMYFIYASFATLGSSLLVYLLLSFVLEAGKILRLRRARIWDL